MEKESRGSTAKIAISLLVATLIQTLLAPPVVPAGLARWMSYIDWLLLVVVYVGLQRAPVQALLTGAAAGIFQDAFSGGKGFGVSGLAYLLAAYVADRIVAWIVVDNLLVRFSAIVAGSLVSTIVRLIFYRMLQVELPVLAGGNNVIATLVFGLFANLIVSVLLYILFDRVFKKESAVRVRRMEARRIRPKL
ncbi:MAG: rod shape-determining protein MreD [Blastocatellia bacterium]